MEMGAVSDGVASRREGRINPDTRALPEEKATRWCSFGRKGMVPMYKKINSRTVGIGVSVVIIATALFVLVHLH
jgi:hypothetical protein